MRTPAQQSADTDAAERIASEFVRSAEKFHAAIVTACFLDNAFESELTLRQRSRFISDPAGTRMDRDRQTAAAKALHLIWRDFLSGKPQTTAEHALALYLQTVVDEAVELEAERAAEVGQ